MADGIRVIVRAKPDRKPLQLVYVCPLTGKDITKSAKTSDWKEAERRAALWQVEVESGKTPGRISWDGFRLRFEEEFLEGKPPGTRRPYLAALRTFEKCIGNPRLLSAVDTSTLSLFSRRLREKKLEPSTIEKHLRHLKSALRWAARLGLIARAPDVVMPKVDRSRQSKGRPLTDAEFAKMLEHVEEVVGKEHATGWEFLLRGLWASGLRLEEAAQLSWDSPPIRLQLEGGRYPQIVWHASGQKSRRDEVTPITPEFAALMKTVPKGRRTGLVFKLTLEKHRLAFDTRSKTISDIGAAAGIVTGKDGKHASAHDLRRSFGSRWATRVAPVILKTMMRHRDVATTLAYYVEIEAGDVGAIIWQFVPHPVPQGGRDGNRKPKKPRKK